MTLGGETPRERFRRAIQQGTVHEARDAYAVLQEHEDVRNLTAQEFYELFIARRAEERITHEDQEGLHG